MSKEENYLLQLTQKLQTSLGDNLIGLYQTGSRALDNYIAGKSDLDVVGIVKESLNKEIKDRIASNLNHANLPCPAQGLDLILFTIEDVRQIKAEPHYGFWFSTGATWPDTAWEEGENKEMLIFIELCRSHAKTLFGESPNAYFAPVKKAWLMAAFVEMLHWHRSKILDPFHDPLGVNSVLNTARVLAFAKTGILLSKTAGGKWFIENEKRHELVEKALAIRNGKAHLALTEEAIALFIATVVESIQK